jgi:hypothetical protein
VSGEEVPVTTSDSGLLSKLSGVFNRFKNGDKKEL